MASSTDGVTMDQRECTTEVTCSDSGEEPTVVENTDNMNENKYCSPAEMDQSKETKDVDREIGQFVPEAETDFIDSRDTLDIESELSPEKVRLQCPFFVLVWKSCAVRGFLGILWEFVVVKIYIWYKQNRLDPGPELITRVNNSARTKGFKYSFFVIWITDIRNSLPDRTCMPSYLNSFIVEPLLSRAASCMAIVII